MRKTNLNKLFKHRGENKKLTFRRPDVFINNALNKETYSYRIYCYIARYKEKLPFWVEWKLIVEILSRQELNFLWPIVTQCSYKCQQILRHQDKIATEIVSKIRKDILRGGSCANWAALNINVLPILPRMNEKFNDLFYIAADIAARNTADSYWIYKVMQIPQVRSFFLPKQIESPEQFLRERLCNDEGILDIIAAWYADYDIEQKIEIINKTIEIARSKERDVFLARLAQNIHCVEDMFPYILQTPKTAIVMACYRSELAGLFHSCLKNAAINENTLAVALTSGISLDNTGLFWRLHDKIEPLEDRELTTSKAFSILNNILKKIRKGNIYINFAKFVYQYNQYVLDHKKFPDIAKLYQGIVDEAGIRYWR